MGLTFKRKDSLEKLFEEFAIEPDTTETSSEASNQPEKKVTFSVNTIKTDEKKDDA